MKISSDEESFVLKVWNKSSRPDVSFQFHLLNALSERGLAVSKPVGWGVNPNADKVLLTTFDGTPVNKLNEKKMIDIANILSRLHQIQVKEMRKYTSSQERFYGLLFSWSKGTR
jgi:Ser/Thr protein kinase RdoA (MazF antagonist)